MKWLDLFLSKECELPLFAFFHLVLFQSQWNCVSLFPCAYILLVCQPPLTCSFLCLPILTVWVWRNRELSEEWWAHCRWSCQCYRVPESSLNIDSKWKLRAECFGEPVTGLGFESPTWSMRLLDTQLNPVCAVGCREGLCVSGVTTMETKELQNQMWSVQALRSSRQCSSSQLCLCGLFLLELTLC